MKRKWMMFAATFAVAWVLSGGILSAQSAQDYTWVSAELRKPLKEQNQSLIDQKLASIVANPDKVDAATYRNARVTQAQRAINAMDKTDAPVKRQLLNEEYLKIAGEIARFYLAADRTDYPQRLSAYGAQLGVVGQITDSTAEAAAEVQVTGALMKEVANGVLPDKNLTVEQKEAILRSSISTLTPLRDKALAAKLSIDLYSQLLVLGTPGSKEAYVGRAMVKVGAGQVEDGLADLAQLLADPVAGDDLKNMARYKRLGVLAKAQRWADAREDAAALSVLSIEKAQGPLFTPSVAAQAKIMALQACVETGEQSRDASADKSVAFLVEVLGAKNLSAEEKSTSLTTVLLDLSKGSAALYQWPQALGLAHAAYEVAPNQSVPATVALIQQILAHGSQTPVSWKSFNVAPEPQDLVKAQAFYARQTGQLQKDGAVIVLAPDLSNQDQFPTQLTAVVVPFNKDVASAIGKIAAGHPDPLTRAMACAVLNEPDKAIEIMMQAINGLTVDSSQLSTLVNFTARFVRAKFESVALANAFLKSQVDGPAGKDGKKGTEDDAPNPLEAVAR